MKRKPRRLDENRQRILEMRRNTRRLRYSSYRSVQKGEERANNFSATLRRLLKYLYEHKGGCIIVFVTCILSTVCNVIGPSYIGEALDVLNEQVALKIEGFEISAESLIPYILMLLAVYGGMAVFSFIQQFTMAGVTARVVRRLREDLNAKLSRMPLKFFDSNAKGDILSRLINDIDNISNTLQHNLVSVVTSIITIIGVFAMMLITNWFLTLVIVVIVPPAAAIALSIMKVSKKLFKAQWDRTGELNGHVEEMYTGHKIVRLFGQEQLAVDEFNDINDELTDVSRRAQFISGTIAPFINLIDNFGYILIAIIGGYLIVNNGVFAVNGTVLYDMGESFTIGGILTFITYSKLFTSPISQLAQIANNLQSSMASSERVFAILDESEEAADKEGAGVEFRDALRFENVSFSYSPDKPLMENLNISVKCGGLVALVGPTMCQFFLGNIQIQNIEVGIAGDIVQITVLTQDIVKGDLIDILEIRQQLDIIGRIVLIDLTESALLIKAEVHIAVFENNISGTGGSAAIPHRYSVKGQFDLKVCLTGFFIISKGEQSFGENAPVLIGNIGIGCQCRDIKQFFRHTAELIAQIIGLNHFHFLYIVDKQLCRKSHRINSTGAATGYGCAKEQTVTVNHIVDSL